MLAEDDGVLVVGKRLDGGDLTHDFFVSTLLGKSFLELLLGLTFKLDSFGYLWCNFLFCISDSCDVVGICVSSDLGCLGLSLFNNFCFDELCFSSDCIIFKFCLSINLLDLSFSLGLPFLPYLMSVSLDLLNFLSLGQLLKLCLLFHILPLLLFDLLFLDFFFLIILDSLLIREGLPFKCVFELVNGSFLHGGGHLLTEHHIGNDDSLHIDALVLQVGVQMVEHTLRVLGSSERVGLNSLDGPAHGTNPLLDVGIDQLVDLGHVGGQLLDVVLLLGELKQN